MICSFWRWINGHDGRCKFEQFKEEEWKR